MRIYCDCYELMSEMARDLWEMGIEVKPKTYQNKKIEGNDDFITKEIISKQYCLTDLDKPEYLFIYSNSKEWADAEFKERISGYPINPGEAYKLREDLWKEFLNGGIFDYTYSERFNQPVVYRGINMTKLNAIIFLLKDDSDTRKAVLDVYGHYLDESDDYHLDGNYRIPCSMYYDFLIRENNKKEKVLHICYHQRSSDFITHFGNDVYLAWLLKDYVANKVGIKSGYLYHIIDSLHSYKKDWVKLKTSLSNY